VIYYLVLSIVILVNTYVYILFIINYPFLVIYYLLNEINFIKLNQDLSILNQLPNIIYTIIYKTFYSLSSFSTSNIICHNHNNHYQQQHHPINNPHKQ